jgi:hypothetical protein
MIKINKIFDDLDLGMFKYRIDKSLLTLNSDRTYDYKGDLDFFELSLKSLTEIPIKFRKVKGNFWCSNNQLISLQGAPLEVGGRFWCSRNKLISLQYAPSTVGVSFFSLNNSLLSKKCLSVVKGEFNAEKNPFSITDKVIETVKLMTNEQQISELNFFRAHDQKAFEMMNNLLINKNLLKEEFKLCHTIK